MKRLKMSLVASFLFPAFYSTLLILVANCFSLLFSFIGRDGRLHQFAEGAFPSLALPISWPSYIYFYFYPPDSEFPTFTGFEYGNLVSLLIGNLVLYFFVSFILLTLYRSWLKRWFPK